MAHSWPRVEQLSRQNDHGSDTPNDEENFVDNIIPGFVDDAIYYYDVEHADAQQNR